MRRISYLVMKRKITGEGFIYFSGFRLKACRNDGGGLDSQGRPDVQISGCKFPDRKQFGTVLIIS
jgi:hypothetical protein